MSRDRVETIVIAALMEQSGVKFGTSGARGLAESMTDRVCYAYTLAFLRHLMATGELREGGAVAIGGDYRPSSPRIMAATAMAVADLGCRVVYCGYLPTPALALYGIEQGIPNVMVTGSHIPDDRNGIKFNKPGGEILKADELAISALEVTIPAGRFDDCGCALQPYLLGEVEAAAYQAYIKRYLTFFPRDCLQGARVGVYEHSSVAREALVEIFAGLGAEVVSLGRSETFIPVDTEAVRPEDVALAAEWVPARGLDCLVSADGDGDRPLISDEQGRWLRGDVAGVLCARYLGADSIATPVSSNSVAEACGWFREVRRTRIGSPFVIEAMEQALAAGSDRVVGYEANGGFLIASAIDRHGAVLNPLPTRDAVIVPLAILMSAREQGMTISALLRQLPPRYTSSDRLQNFPTELSRARIAAFNSGDFSSDAKSIETAFPGLGRVTALDTTDGLRITFDSDEVVHLRPSGNAPELRCYNEAASEARAEELNRHCLAILEGWRE